MMEKYGVSFETLPPTKEQKEELEKLAKEGKISVEKSIAKNRQEAEDLILKIKMEDLK